MRALSIAERIGLLSSLATGTACATIVHGNEAALYYSAANGIQKDPVPSGWHWHWPWNDYVTYDLRWVAHKEDIHIHSMDGLHMNIEVVVVVRPNPAQIYALDTEVGPDFYEGVVRPEVYGATRDATGQFGHLEIATETHRVEEAIHRALLQHLEGKHVELSQVAIQSFDLPDAVEAAANKKATAAQTLAAKEIELGLAKRDAEIEQVKRKSAIDVQGLEKKLRGEQELAQTELQIQIEREKRKAALEKAESEAAAVRIKAEGDAEAVRVKAAAERARIQAVSQNLSPNYVRIQAIEALGRAMSAGNQRVLVVPVGKDGLPAYFAPFLNPYAKGLLGLEATR